MSASVRCLACGHVYPIEMVPMCPNRYLSPHDERFMTEVAKRVVKMKRTPENHATAIRRARKSYTAPEI